MYALSPRSGPIFGLQPRLPLRQISRIEQQPLDLGQRIVIIRWIKIVDKVTAHFRNRRAVGSNAELALDEALTRLAAVEPELARLVELRFFTGLGVEEAVRTLGVSPRTAKRNWSYARAWLRREMDRSQRG